MRLREVTSALTLVLAALLAAEPAPAQRAGMEDPWAPVDWDAPVQPVLIENGTLITMAGERIEGGSILLIDGSIAAIGTDLDAPGDARVIDATGRFVTPGLVDAHSHIAADAINEGSVNVSSMVGIEQVIDPTDINIYREAAGGVTTSHVMHGSANPIGGKNAIIKHRWGEDAEGLVFRAAPPTIKFALGENPRRVNFSFPGMPRRYPGTRMGVIDVIRQAFRDAVEYRAEWDAWRAGGRRGVPPARDLALEPLVEVLEGERFVHAHSYRADEILQLMRLAEETGFRIAVFQHVLEGYKVADEIREHGAMASTFSDWWAYKLEAYDAIPHNAALMTDRGVVVSINSDSPEEARHLGQEAAKTMKWGGMTEEQALAMVTINPAVQLRVEDRVGSLEEGKDADVVIWEGEPLSSTSRVTTTIVDGRIVFDLEMDERRQEAIAAEKERLEKALEEDGDGEDDEESEEPETEEPEPRKGGQR